ncbi:MAG: PqqD family protein [Bacteroidales bacterium]
MGIEKVKLCRLSSVKMVELDDEIILSHQEKNYVLNASGVEIWEMLKQPITTKEIIERVAETYNVQLSLIESDVIELLESFVIKGLIEKQA